VSTALKKDRMKHDNNRLIWIDLEMTGLNPATDKILEIATVITDDNLNIIAQGPHLIIHQSNEVIASMNDWCQIQHNKTGLVKAVQESEVSQEEAEMLTLAFLQEHCDENSTPLCGNSVWQDKIFLTHHMPDLAKFFHYRIIDVSSIKLVINRWTKLYKIFPKNDTHRALDDIKESIAELKFYKENFFMLPDQL